ncbi:MAG: M48 family metallopeptidase [Planctomycetes bacterium]|nr:M48 family metallopeptidase [Planctomycetota bacterium]
MTSGNNRVFGQLAAKRGCREESERPRSRRGKKKTPSKRNDFKAFRRVLKNEGGVAPPRGRILLNPELIVAPLPCIEYVVVHELCHVRHHNHGPDFYRLLAAMMPDWATRRERLNQCVAA